MQLVRLVGGFGVFFLSHTAPGSHLWFYFLLCMWVVHWGLLRRLPWRAWVCPVRAGVELGQLLGSQGFWQHQVLSGVGGSGSRKYSPWEGMAARTGQYAPAFLPGNPLSDREARQATVYRVTKSRTQRSDPARIDARLLSLRQLCP